MCGISGIFDTTAACRPEELAQRVAAMTDTLRHRGPDDAGLWTDAGAGIGLGHRRLSIVDLSPTGHQPMLSEDGRYVMAFNGEVYNFRSLRADLEPRGHRFRGTSDTEVMLAAISEWGLEKALGRFVGMFAFALWDRQQRTLSLVRDRIGIKPLYFGWSGTTLLFGSELKALRCDPGFHAEVNHDSLALFFRYGYVPSPHAIYRDACKLLPGTFVVFSAGGRTSPEPIRFWSAEEAARRGLDEPFRGSDGEAVDELERLLREAVRLRMIADVPLGAFLSGGIDSSAVVALMQEESGRPVKTFTVGFRQARYDEAADARAVARHLGTDHHDMQLDERDALEFIPQLAEWYDEPFADSSQLPTLLVSRSTRRHVTVALSGDGGDELFAGYIRYPWAAAIAPWMAATSIPRRLVASGLRAVPPAWFDQIARWLPSSARPRLLGDKIHRAADTLALATSDELCERLVAHSLDGQQVVPATRALERSPLDEAIARALPSATERLQFFDLVRYLPDDILTKVDRASMAVALEVRVPILDHRVVEFAWRLPRSLKIRGGARKWILRQVLRRYVPDSLVDRPKMGFAVPLDSWLRGPLRGWAEELLTERRLRDASLEPAPIRERWAEHLSGRRNWQFVLWDVLVFQAWRARWAGAPPARVDRALHG